MQRQSSTRQEVIQLRNYDKDPTGLNGPQNLLERLTVATERIAQCLNCLPLIAARVIPSPAEVVGSPYVAQRLGVTTVWVAEMARKGAIPKNCIVNGTGSGKPWKFHREKIDRWIEDGRLES